MSKVMMKNTLSRINLSKLFRWSGWLVAAICLGQWLIGLFLAVMLFVTRRGLLQGFNLIWLAGLLTLTAVF